LNRTNWANCVARAELPVVHAKGHTIMVPNQRNFQNIAVHKVVCWIGCTSYSSGV